MARQQAAFHNRRSAAAGVLIGLGIFALFGVVGGPVVQVYNLLGLAAGKAILMLSCMTPSVFRALQVFALDHYGFPPCLVGMLVSCWRLFYALAGAA